MLERAEKLLAQLRVEFLFLLGEGFEILMVVLVEQKWNLMKKFERQKHLTDVLNYNNAAYVPDMF